MLVWGALLEPDLCFVVSSMQSPCDVASAAVSIYTRLLGQDKESAVLVPPLADKGEEKHLF